MERKKITFDSFIRGVILGVIIIGILMLFKRLSGVLLPFFIAWLIAYLIYPLVTFFQYRLRLKNRVISIFCALFSILIAGGAAFYLLVPPMMDEFVRVKDLVIDYFSNGTHDGNVPKTLSEFLRENIDTQFVTQLFKEENMLNAIKETVPRLWSLLSESVNLLFSFFTFFLILLYIVFILLDYESIAEGWTHLVPQKYRPFVVSVMNDVKDGMNRYFRGQAFVALCVGILFSIGFLIIDFPLAIGLGLFIGALNLVPYLQIIGFIPTIVAGVVFQLFPVCIRWNFPALGSQLSCQYGFSIVKINIIFVRLVISGFVCSQVTLFFQGSSVTVGGGMELFTHPVLGSNLDNGVFGRHSFSDVSKGVACHIHFDGVFRFIQK